MSDTLGAQERGKTARAALRQAEETLYTRRSRLRHKQTRLANALRQGQAGNRVALVLRREIQVLEAQIEEDAGTLSTARDHLAGYLRDFPLLDQPWDLVEHLNDNLPFLLFPVRIETRFMKVENRTELWVRIFPDDIAVHTHEEALTVEEVSAGQAYWREIWVAHQETEDEKKQAITKGAWRVLAGAYDGMRAAWIALQTQPSSLDVGSLDALEFPEFDPETLKEESWTRAPRSNIMPDRFVIMAYSGGKEIFRELCNLIPSPLIMGPDPQGSDDEFQQMGGELLVGESLAWIYDFDKAIEIGLGRKISIKESHATQGFDRLLVLGLRLSSDERENQTLLEDLIENHHYSPDGMSLIPQGTPTNNTDSGGSGFSSQGPGPEASFAIENGDVLFQPTPVVLEKQDGQRLAEALGINYASLQHVQHADRRDGKDAMLMNKALWHGTLGYYMEELLELDLTTIGLTREFFTEYVSGRGPLSAIRTGVQPYGVLLTSNFSAWQWSRTIDGDRFPFLERLHEVGTKVEVTWRKLADRVVHVGAGGDPHENLLNMLGLHATSVDYYRRHAVETGYIYNFAAFNPGAFVGPQMLAALKEEALSLLNDLGFDFDTPPRLFDLAFFRFQNQITDPLVDDISSDETEKLSETKRLKAIYKVPDSADGANYISWLVHSTFDDIKAQRFEAIAGEPESPPIPRPLLYRMLRGALLHTVYDATMQLYTTFSLVPVEARREVELSNIQEDRTVTRWEFMEADVSGVMPQLSQESQSVGRFLQTEAGLSQPEALSLREVRECLEALTDVDTASLERIFSEHIDLCSYRLDAWQTGFFNRRLQQLRFPRETGSAPEARVQGIYLGAFGWVEDLRPAPDLVAVDPSAVADSLHDFDRNGPLFTQPDNGGLIHGPSINHAVAAAVLRSTYLTHFDENNREKMTVNLSSERVRTALRFLEGIRNGQDLGALLGYQFERGLHERYGDPSLNQYILFFRQKYPLLADKITQDESGANIETKEARNVMDGYALLEVTFLREEDKRLPYPYDIAELPAPPTLETDPEPSHMTAIKAEVSRMADTFDAIADLAMAEGVYQATQGNFDRAGAMLKAFTEGNNPPEPEIVRTPRSGAALTQRLTLHLETENQNHTPNPWPGTLSERAKIEPGLNKWLGDLLPLPSTIQYGVGLGESLPIRKNLVGLELQPIDLVYMIGDELADESTELESRIAYEFQREKGNDSLVVNIEFMNLPPVLVGSTETDGITLFELLPLLRTLREMVTGCRPLAADDFGLPSEASRDLAEDANPKGYDLDELDSRVEQAFGAFNDAVGILVDVIPAPDSEGNLNLALANARLLRDALKALADFGVPDAIPLSAVGTSDEAKVLLVNQAIRIKEIVERKVARADELKTAGQGTALTAEERTAKYREAAQEIFGPAFNLIPVFNLKNQAEMQTAADFRDTNRLIRHHPDNPHIVDEWLQGVARVREKMANLESILLFAGALEKSNPVVKPLQLPFRESDYWVAVEYPEVAPQDVDSQNVFVPEGDFLSIVQWLPSSGFSSTRSQKGLLVDEWVEVIPGRRETTGIAIHYNQPNTEPPQVLLLAVTPEITGAWTWKKLVGILHNTLDRAKQRGVEPDHLGATAFGHLLPAIVSAVSSSPLATISTDFVHETAVATLNSTTENG